MAAPDDTRWTVRVVWEPRWRALARRFGGWRRNRKQGDSGVGDLVDGVSQVASSPSSSGGGGSGGDFDLGDALIVIAVIFIGFIAAAALFWWVLLPLLLILLDLLIVLVLLLVAVIGRVLFGRPWTVQATASNGERLTAQVVGWRAALRHRDEMAESLRSGLRPADAASPVQFRR